MFKEKPDAKWIGGSGDLSERPRPAKVPTCETKLRGS